MERDADSATDPTFKAQADLHGDTSQSPSAAIARAPQTMAGPSRLSIQSQHQLMGDELLGNGEFPPSKWTEVTTDDGLVRHLITLYFCWEYPTFASLSKEHFLLDYNSGRPRFCSSLLVNVILSMGATLSDLKQVRSDPEDADTAGNHFFAEAQRLLSQEDIPSVTTIQALNLMALRQARSGNDISSWHYARNAMRIALDIDLPSDDPEQEPNEPYIFTRAERQVRVATFWGCFALEQ